MREIKFRGKRRDNNQITYGDLCIYDDMVFIGIAKTITEIRKDVFVPSVIWYEVEPENVGQFTGILDKNKKEIYEGDIVKHRNGISKIIFNHLSFTIHNEQEFETYLHEWWTGDLEVIGNIYENPELIK
mgnify:CR=1 FL=1